MIIIKIKAGLGNQLFQYAFGRVLSLTRNEDLLLDISSFNNQPEREAKRSFALEKFAICASIANAETVKKYNAPWRIFLKKLQNRIAKKSAYTFYPNLLTSKKTYYEGHWINQKYFLQYRDVIIKELTLKEKLGERAQGIVDEIHTLQKNGSTPVSLNIRRGDFVTNPYSAFNGVLGVAHYQKAIDYLQKERGVNNIHVFVFSDDIEWAKVNLTLPCTIHFVSNPEIYDYEELSLIRECTHNIIANSTFSWWGAWLNTNPTKIVVAPYQWLKDKNVKELDILPDNWVAI